MGFKHFLREVFAGCSIECHPDKGYELHRGYGWGKVVVTDKAKYNEWMMRDFNRLFKGKPKEPR